MTCEQRPPVNDGHDFIGIKLIKYLTLSWLATLQFLKIRKYSTPSRGLIFSHYENKIVSN